MDFNFKFSLSIILIITFAIISCERPKTSENRFPSTQEEIQKSSEDAQRIGKESAVIIENAISKAFNQNGVLNLSEIATNIELIEGVVSATPTPSGAVIVVEQKDGTFLNLLVVTKNDNRLFTVSKKEIIKNTYKRTKNSTKTFVAPNGSGKALILAPFQYSFKSNLDTIAGFLKSAGYAVDTFLNSHADLKHFEGSFLNNYDVVYISTHGSADGSTRNGITSTILLTGERQNEATNNLISVEEWIDTGIGNLSNDNQYYQPYYALTVPWLNLTTDENFTNTWIYADACESAKDDSGPSSLSETFLNLGVGGYNGFNESISIPVANLIMYKMFSEFSSDISFADASNNVREDPLLLAIKWTIGLGGIVKSLDVTIFDDNQLSSQPFYLIDPANTVKDFDGNIYHSVIIGSQVWMKENLKTTKYSDGTAIPNVTVNATWAALTNGAYSDYSNTPSNSTTYGRLYNWYAVDNNAATKVASNGGKNVCPTGWHVPSETEWMTLANYLGGESIAGGKLKEAGTAHWQTPNTGATNETGFTALPGGCRDYAGAFGGIVGGGGWWSSTAFSAPNAYYRLMYSSNSYVRSYSDNKHYGFSVRCLKD
jgi:uncharacterized protein (TIGR02145 family)